MKKNLQRFTNQFTWMALLLLASNAAQAASTGHDVNHIPYKAVFWQVTNLTIIFLIVIFKFRKPIGDFFKKRRTDYEQLANRAQQERQQAESQLTDIQEKLKHLRQTKEESLRQARDEAQALKTKMIQEAQAQAKRIQQEADDAKKLELQRAVNDFKEMLITKSIGAATMVLKSDIGQNDHQRLQQKFVDTVGV